MVEKKIKKYLNMVFSLFFVISAILLILAIYSWNENFVTGAMYAQIGIAQLVISVIGLVRLKLVHSNKEDLLQIGKVGIQHSWVITSIGLAGVALFRAPYFYIDAIITNIAFVIAILYLVLGVFSLYKTKEDTGQFLSI